MRYFILICLFVMYGCSNGNTDKVVEKAFQENSINVDSDYKKSLDTLRLMYEKSVINIKKDDSIKAIHSFYILIKQNLSYIDSLKVEIQKSDSSGNEIGRNSFINNGISDSVYNRILMLYSLAESLATVQNCKNEIQKERHAVLNEYASSQTKEQLFAMNTLWGISMVLYGFEKELISVSILALTR